ncbi:MAG: hypothetical protein ACOC0P_06405 [Planctomycetota bacterium]
MNLDNTEFNPQASGGTEDETLAERQAEGAGLGDAAFDLQNRSRGKIRVSDSVAVMVATCVVAGGVLFGMRYMTQRSGERVQINEETIKVLQEFLIHKAGHNSDVAYDTQAQELVRGLTDDRTNVQVPVDMLKKNPFYVMANTKTIDDPFPGPKLGDEDELRRREQQRQQRRQQLDRQADRIKLSSITGRKGNYLALINGQVVRVGDLVDEVFTVRRIEQYKVFIGSPDDHGWEREIELRRF